jgi:hypothetical protein
MRKVGRDRGSGKTSWYITSTTPIAFCVTTSLLSRCSLYPTSPMPFTQCLDLTVDMRLWIGPGQVLPLEVRPELTVNSSQCVIQGGGASLAQ